MSVVWQRLRRRDSSEQRGRERPRRERLNAPAYKFRRDSGRWTSTLARSRVLASTRVHPARVARVKIVTFTSTHYHIKSGRLPLARRGRRPPVHARAAPLHAPYLPAVSTIKLRSVLHPVLKNRI